ncbi:uncharacterized protein BO97DRAFT_408874 [Aspergillus homomorphus CBS 101889]|uniref:Uncharacterized protein n=1 Tax=Aspergillus homomorphus (strain CBS 101889) TaxID=1450537 RepID=A0A395HJ42_ASPHC|nr:hypothetical protein BO97DRAFT_408874 [Aspergillus homomorphus CBS 101889]RAL07656.1 hypothetical protein BO97DRAFT_408874 [Aspergillus homomorphus CBS 101889]
MAAQPMGIVDGSEGTSRTATRIPPCHVDVRRGWQIVKCGWNGADGSMGRWRQQTVITFVDVKPQMMRF